MKTVKLSSVFFSLVILLFLSCTKEGKQGEPGPQGINGSNGNANVQSTLITAYVWNWDSGSSSRYQTWTGISSLTFDIASTGAVFLYQSTSGGNGFVQLPVTSKVTPGIVESDYFEYGTGTLQVVIQNSNGSDPISQITTPTYYKLITISSSAKLAHPNVDYTNFEEVKVVYNLKD